ncbi:MFS transporter [Pantoea ananatis]|uniref:MFS transporter n=1 Tax=Pantoea ananas TaxID=553 RepID=UPI001902E4AD|nr:MFS transporter [Pantoea ananatis]
MAEKVFCFERFRTLPIQIRLILFSSLLSRTAFFMTWPFLSVVLYIDFGLSPTIIGLMLTTAMAIGAMSSIYTGWLSDFFGRRKLVLGGSILIGLSFLLFVNNKSVIVFGVALAGISIGSSFLESTYKVLVGDFVSDPKSRELALHTNYFLMNIGSSIGPLCGMLLFSSYRPLVFFLCSLTYFISGVMMFFMLKNNVKLIYKNEEIVVPGFFKAIVSIFKHRSFALLTICYTLAAFVYASFDTTLPQYLARFTMYQTISLLVILISLNSLMVIFFQFPLMHLLQPLTIKKRLQLGMVFLLTSQFFFAYSFMHIIWFLIFATILLSIGEMIVFPTFSVEVDRQAQSGLRGTYFGISALYRMGIAFSPLYGGAMLDILGGKGMYIGLAIICGLIMTIQKFLIHE